MAHNTKVYRNFSLILLSLVIFNFPIIKTYAYFFGFFGSNVEASYSDSFSSNLIDIDVISYKSSPLSINNPHYLMKDDVFVPQIGVSSTYSKQEETFFESNDEISVYLVRENDTLKSISEMFDISINTIVWANNLDRSKALKKNQELVILPISGIQHKIKKGETLNSIAVSYRGDVEDIKIYNGIFENSELIVGENIIIPDGEIKTENKNQSSKTSVKYFIKPAKGVKSQGLHGHNGIDFAGKIGDAVFAAAEGKVIIARMGWNGGYGNYVVIKHNNGTQTLYGHLSSLSVSTGDFVKQGQVLGGIGNTGKSTGPHLHFEVRNGKNPF